MTVVRWSSQIDAPPEALFAFHADVRNLARISPPFPPFRLVSPPAPTREGDVQVFRLGWGPIGVDWHARITRVEEGRLIEDTHERGPFRRWRHQHRFSSEGSGARLTDVVAFRLLPTPVGEFLEWLLVRPALAGMFAYRHRQTRKALEQARTS
ncbi:SRPBCC family protein [Tepidiforma sp.]|uniref:SRPBCC family protein n=1 Tax=Tepidiforma sp. TaxID=2682230 RepID=UPI002ADE345B|nr:SRPBCC family protein [Tepidiforma sp.]